MHVARLAAFVLALALSGVTGAWAFPGSASGAPGGGGAGPVPNTGPGPGDTVEADTLTVITEYTNGATVEVVDVETGVRRLVEDSRGKVPPTGIGDHHDHAHGHGHGPPTSGSARSDTSETSETGETADAGDDGGAGTASTNPRCTNDDAFEYIRWGSGDAAVREARPWRMPLHEVRFHPDGVPSSVNFDWRAAILEGSRVWEETRNPCGVVDTIVWETPPVGPDSTTSLAPAPGSNCPATDRESTIGWWTFESSGLLARACLWSSLGWIFEADIIFNNNSGVKWCAKACSGGFDLQSVASHEWGHVLGLGHTCGESDLPSCSGNTDAQAAVMYPFINSNDEKNRTLSKGDIDGATSLYPAAYTYEVVALELVNEADPHPLVPGATYIARVDLRNTAFQPWAVNGAIELGTAGGSPSDYANDDWLSPSRATKLDEDRTNHVNERWPTNDHTVVVRDEVGRFEFSITVPWSKEPASGTLTEILAMALHERDFVDPAPLDFTLETGFLDANVVGTTGPRLVAVDGVIVQGLQSVASATVENIGTAPWIRSHDTIRLVPDPFGSCSPFMGNDWAACDDVTGLHPTVSVVAPGQQTTFDFRMSSPIDPGLLGPQEERFTVMARGRPIPSVVSTSPAVFQFLVL